MKWHNITQLLPHLYQVTEGGFVSFFILQGKESTVLVDCGYGIDNTYERFKDYFVGDVCVVNTHIHPDHSNANRYFKNTIMHTLEWEKHAKKWNENTYKIKEGKWDPAGQLKLLKLDKKLPYDFDPKKYNDFVAKGIPTPSFLEEGDVLDIGNFELEVIFTPTHTQGSICLLDKKQGLLFAGDTLCKDMKWLLNLNCRASLTEIYDSYELLAGRANDVRYVLPSHGEVLLASGILVDIHSNMKEIKKGVFKPTFQTNKYVAPGYYYDFGGYGPVMGPEVISES